MEIAPKISFKFTFAGAHLVRAPRVRSAVRRGDRGARPAQRAEVVQEGGKGERDEARAAGRGYAGGREGERSEARAAG